MTTRRRWRHRYKEAERDRELARHASDIVLIVDAQARVQYLSPSAESTMGYRADEWLGRNALEVFHPDDAELAVGAFGRALARPGVNDPLEARVRRVGGEWRWFEVVATNLVDHPAIRGVVICARDITALRSAQDELATTAARFEAVLANLSDLVTVIDADGNMTYVSPSTERIVGRRAADRVGASIFDFVHPDDVAAAAKKLEQALAKPGLVDPFDTRLRHEDGTYRVFEVRANNLLDDPVVRGIIVNSRDITDRVNAENARHESDRLYRTIVETADEGVWMIDAEAVTTFVNDRMAAMLGTTADAMIGRLIFDFVDDEGRELAETYLERRRAGIVEHHDFKLVRADGEAVWTMLTSSPFIDDDGTYQGAIALISDISARRRVEAALHEAERARYLHEAEIERHRLEAQLAQARRLESLGRLAAGMAHDYNNLLGVILNYTTVASRHVDEGSPVATDIARIEQAAEQAADVTRRLLVFGRVDSMDVELLDLNPLVENVVSLVRSSFDRSIAVETRLAARGCFIRADRGQIEQTLMNLLLNARDAITKPGSVIITTHHEPDMASASPAPSSPHVVLTVADDGTGMSRDVLQRAFEPFFTTKTAEHGSGLGLAAVQAMVERTGGEITIESEPNVGTKVYVRLPAAEK